MSGTILMGQGSAIITIPADVLEKHLQAPHPAFRERFPFMTGDHHRLRCYVVEQLPRRGVPLTPEDIAQALDMPLARVVAILDDLEANLFFLVRSGQGAVAWAFPVTAEETAHRLKFSSGEAIYAA